MSANRAKNFKRCALEQPAFETLSSFTLELSLFIIMEGVY